MVSDLFFLVPRKGRDLCLYRARGFAKAQMTKLNIDYSEHRLSVKLQMKAYI